MAGLLVVDHLVARLGPFLIPAVVFVAGVLFYLLLWLYYRDDELGPR